ncbi:enoyl-CoA delta isomerase 1, mitochondrial-like [Dysidea avara]|uniref:enoyl-CoA delta isomerase 1, mitochondrial-like n=1 Tax=Dysidea avara TaxID=196820 RepID=UPI00333444DE
MFLSQLSVRFRCVLLTFCTRRTNKRWELLHPKSSLFRLSHTQAVIANTKNIQVVESSKEQTAIVLMKRGKVNSFNSSFLEDFVRCISIVEKDKKYSAIILSSSIQGVFSAGLDFQVLLNSHKKDIEVLWNAMQDAWICLYSTRLATIAAINGHCLAAGCAFAFSCDTRIAQTGDYKIGITAARVGITAPLWVYQVFAQLVGFHQAEMSMLQALLYSPVDAYNKGMVDHLSEGPSVELITNAVNISDRYLQVSQDARAEMKLSIRSSLLDKVKATRKQELDEFVKHICSNSVQKYLQSVVQ